MLVPYHSVRRGGGAMPAFRRDAIQCGTGLGGALGGVPRNIVLPTVKTVGKSLL